MDALGTTRYTMPLVLASMLLVALTESVQLFPSLGASTEQSQASLISLSGDSPSAELRRFAGTRQGRNVILEWTAHREHDLMSYEIQRASSASRGWERVGTMAAVNGGIPQTYNFIDRNVPAEDVRYLLRIHGRNNEILYSDIIVVALDGIVRSFAVMPEPSGRLNTYIISVGLNKQGKVELVLNNADGHTVERIFTSSELGPGEHTFNLDGTDLIAGSYSVKLQTPDGDFQRSLILGK